MLFTANEHRMGIKLTTPSIAIRVANHLKNRALKINWCLDVENMSFVLIVLINTNLSIKYSAPFSYKKSKNDWNPIAKWNR